MKRKVLLVALPFLLLAGLVIPFIAFGVGETTGTNTAVATACADAAVPAKTITGPTHTLARDGGNIYTEPGDVSTIPGATDHKCQTSTNIQTYTIPTVTQTVTTGPPSPTGDTIAFPRLVSHLAFSFDDGNILKHFQMNILRGCYPHAADLSYALNPNQVNFIVPGTSVSPDGIAQGPSCGAEPGFAVTYGSGYPSLTTSIASPYPGIGTIRPYDTSACMGGDTMCTTAGTKISLGNGVFLDWTNFTNSNAPLLDTSTWGAKVRAHFYQKDLSTGSHPGVHGIWGDNFTWSEPYFQDDHEGTDTQMDDGAIRNAQVLNSLLPAGTLQGANGQGMSCGFGDVYAGSVPGKDCTGVGDNTAWDGYGGYVNIHNPTRFDAKFAEFDRWLNSPSGDGRPKRGFINVYGLTGTNAVGHILTAQDQRMNLAFACIGGVYLWAVNGDNWNTTAIPGNASGTNFAIPEMGDTATFPRGWLGLPTGPATKISSGQWKRVFTGGIVYANAVNAAWSIDGRTVPAWDGLFVKT